MTRSWKTFTAGVASFAGGIGTLIAGYVGLKKGTLQVEALAGVVTAGITGIATGIGLMFARDNNVSSVDVGIQGVTTNLRGEAVVTPLGPDASQELKDKMQAEHGL